MRLNAMHIFTSLRESVLYARARAEMLEKQRYTVDRFNGSDWVWMAINLNNPIDEGILIQILLDPDAAEKDFQEHLKDIKEK